MKFAFCPYCGHKLDDDFAFCPKCGKRLNNDGGAETSANATEQTDDLFGGALGDSNANPSDFDFSSLGNMLDGEIERKKENDKKYKLINLLCIRGKYDEATSLCNELFESDPDDLAAYAGFIRIESKNYTIFEGAELEKAISVAHEICGNRRLEDFDKDLSSYLKTRINELLEIDGTTLIRCKKRDYQGAIEIPEGITKITRDAFYNCSLSSITIPESLKEIDRCFTFCNRLTEIKVKNGNSKYYSKDNCIIEKKSKILVYGCGASKIPEGITGIGKEAFDCCPMLKDVHIPNSVTFIGESAFASTGITSVTIPHGVQLIERYAFCGCESLKSIELPNTITKIAEYGFQSCKSLTSIYIPDSVISIGEWAFAYCESLTNITLPKGITNIEKYTFNRCISLKNIDIPKGLVSIKNGAFKGCKSLRSIELPHGLSTIESSVFDGCSSLTSLNIPISVKKIHSFTTTGDRFLENQLTLQYEGSSSEWKKIDIVCVLCKVYCKKDGVTLSDENIWKYQ